MSKYGYVGKESDIPQQAFKANAGVLSVNDHLTLSHENKLTQYGQLELIETKEVTSAVTYFDFVNIKEDEYDVHFLIWETMHPQSDNKTLTLKYSSNGGSSFISSGYSFAFINGNEDNTFLESRSDSIGFQYLSTGVGTGTQETAQGYCYIYKAGDIGSYTLQSFQSADLNASNDFQIFSGGHIYKNNATINAFRVGENSGTSTWTGNISLYGLRSY